MQLGAPAGIASACSGGVPGWQETRDAGSPVTPGQSYVLAAGLEVVGGTPSPSDAIRIDDGAGTNRVDVRRDGTITAPANATGTVRVHLLRHVNLSATAFYAWVERNDSVATSFNLQTNAPAATTRFLLFRPTGSVGVALNLTEWHQPGSPTLCSDPSGRVVSTLYRADHVYPSLAGDDLWTQVHPFHADAVGSSCDVYRSPMIPCGPYVDLGAGRSYIFVSSGFGDTGIVGAGVPRWGIHGRPNGGALQEIFTVRFDNLPGTCGVNGAVGVGTKLMFNGPFVTQYGNTRAFWAACKVTLNVSLTDVGITQTRNGNGLPNSGAWWAPWAVNGTYGLAHTFFDGGMPVGFVFALPMIPTASFTTSAECRTVSLDASASGSAIDAHNWTFGDGTFGPDAPTAMHSYSANGTYLVTLRVTNASGSATTTRSVVAAACPPRAPTGLAASPSGAGGIALAWQAPAPRAPPDGGAPIAHYHVYRGTSAGSETFFAVVDGSTLSYLDTGLPSGATRSYRVSASAADSGEGSLSSGASATSFRGPGAPENVVTAPGAPSGVSLSWDPPLPDPERDGGFEIEQYRIYRGRTSASLSFLATVDEDVRSFLDHPCGVGTSYVYRVTATTIAGEGDPSGDVTGTASDPEAAGACVPDVNALLAYESPTGNTPFGGFALKPLWPGAPARAPIDLATGELRASFRLTDVAQPLGPPFPLEITYRSVMNAEGDPSLSRGWHASWLQRLDAVGTELALHTGDGRTLPFVPVGSAWEGPPGTYARITSVAGKLELRDREGIRRTFDPAKGHALTSLCDRASNCWALSYAADGRLTRATDPLGRAFTLEYDPAATVGNPFFAEHGRPILTGVTDPAGRTTVLGYHAPSGTLTSIATPGPGNAFVTGLEYDPTGRIVAVTDPTGEEYATIEHDGAGRVRSQRASTGAAFAISYDDVAGVTSVRDAEGNVVDWTFGASSLQDAAARSVLPSAMTERTRGLRPTDPLNFTTRFDFSDAGELAVVILPKGNSIRYAYDANAADLFARGNLLKEERLPAPGDSSPQSTSQANLTTTYTYDPACHKPATIVDPRAYDVTFEPPNGGITTPARYTTRITYTATCQLASVLSPRVNPAGVPDPAFTPAYGNQVVNETFTYNAAGQLLTYRDAAGVLETRAYHPAPSAPGRPAGHLANVTIDSGAPPRLALRTSFEYTPFGALTKVVDPRGNAREVQVDARGRPTQETGPAVDAVSGARAGLRTRWSYDANDNVVQIGRETDAGSGRFTTVDVAYDALGRTTSVTTHPTATHAITERYEYDGNGRLVRRVGGAGEARTWSFDERGLLLSQSGPEGGTYAFDANGGLASRTDPLGRVTTFEHDMYDRRAVTTDALGTRTITSYDAASHVVETKVIGGTSGRVASQTQHAYDEAGRPYLQRSWMQDADTMTAAGAPTQATPAGRWVTTLTEFDTRGLPTRTIDDNRRMWSRAYDGARRVTNETDPVGNVVRHAYDANGNEIALTHAVANAANATCPQTCTTAFQYDAEDRLVLTIHPDATTQARVYDGRGNLVRAIDAAGATIDTFFDDADRPLAIERAHAAGTVRTTTGWDDEGRVRSVCDDAGACTTRTFVPATTLVATEERPIGPAVSIVRDAAGNAVSASYSSGRSLAFAYDPLDRLASVGVEGAPASDRGVTRQTFAYDDLGRVTRATDDGVGRLGAGVVALLPEITATFRYDTLGRVLTESQLGLPVQHTVDGMGNVLTTTYPSPVARVVSRSYDQNERVARVWDAKGLVAAYAYEGDRVKSKQHGGPTPSPPATGIVLPVARSVVAYDGMARPAEILHQRGVADLARLTTDFDDTGGRRAQRLQGPNAGDPFSQRYTTDALHRTVSWEQGSLTPTLDDVPDPISEQSWTDITGQNEWTTWSKDGVTCTRTATIGGLPPTRIVTDDCGSAGARVFTFDADGNLASDGARTFRWDALNRLISVDDANGLVVAYAYDALGRRTIKIFPDNVAGLAGVQGTRESWYTYAGQQVVQESQPIGSVLPNGVSSTPPGVHVIRQWVYGPAIDEVLAMDVDANANGASAIDAADARYFYASDGIGNVLGLMNAQGRLVEGYAYEPYGAPKILVPASGQQDVKWDGTDRTSTGTYGRDPTPRPYSPSGNLWFFTGRQYDPELGTYDYRARQYHPALGQFMSLDPSGAWTDPVALGNPYAYVGLNPGSWTDPSGRCPWCIAGVALVATAGAILVDTAVYGFEVATTGQSWDHAQAREMYLDDFRTGGEALLLMAGEIPAAPRAAPRPGPAAPLAKPAASALVRLADDASGAPKPTGSLQASAPPVRQPSLPRQGASASLRTVSEEVFDDVLTTPLVTSPKLQNIVKDFYKGTGNPKRVGMGTTADAVRYEAATGLDVHGKRHFQKADALITRLQQWLDSDLERDPGVAYRDRLIAKSLLDDLRDARGSP